MPINRAFQTLKKPRKDGFHAVLETIYSSITNNTLLYIECENEVYNMSDKYISNKDSCLVEEMKKYDDIDEKTLAWINMALSMSSYQNNTEKQKIKAYIKEIEVMENNKK